jgi:CRISPR-associated endonuclease/helicase Cas3
MELTIEKSLIAHCSKDHATFHRLEEHLICTALQAERNGVKFGLAKLLYLLGLLHDLGKALEGFQTYIQAACRDEKAEKFPHAAWGSLLVYKFATIKSASDIKWLSILAPIYSHHAGLKEPGYLFERMQNQIIDSSESLQHLRSYLVGNNFQTALKVLNDPYPETSYKALRIRMILSALVDADHSDTSSYYSGFCDLKKNLQLLHWNIFEKDQAEIISTDSEIGKIRKEIYDACVLSSTQGTGFFRLTVPTGGGKTRSGMAFAIQHALEHSLERIIVVIPYTSIIDQNARVYREIFEKVDNEAVLEHHSQIVIPDEQELGEDQRRTAASLRRATLNWNAPIVVTTTVQFFESLFSDRPGSLRKLHNIANSVIILDEAQALPAHLLKPIEKALKTLMDEYNCTVVFSTATQPAMDVRQLGEFRELDRGEIVPEFEKHFCQLERVVYEQKSYEDLEQLAVELRRLDQVLIVLNTRQEALRLLRQLKEQFPDKQSGLYHLSTLLCPSHRRKILAEVTQRIEDKQSVILVSTQVVEAGVDLDFPVVYRAMGPMDRIIQAAGRCNRNMNPGKKGRVIIFDIPDAKAPGGSYAKGIATTQMMLNRNEANRLHEPQFQKEYFESLFRDMGDELDKKEILHLEEKLRFPDVAKAFKMIEQDTVPVVVTYENAKKIMQKFIDAPSQNSWRRLQHYTVNVYRYQIEKMDMAKKIIGDLYEWTGKYDELFGMQEGLFDPADLISSA